MPIAPITAKKPQQQKADNEPVTVATEPATTAETVPAKKRGSYGLNAQMQKLSAVLNQEQLKRVDELVANEDPSVVRLAFKRLSALKPTRPRGEAGLNKEQSNIIAVLVAEGIPSERIEQRRQQFLAANITKREERKAKKAAASATASK